MDIRCTHCGAPFEGTPVESIVTCVFCHHAMPIESAPSDAPPHARPWSDYDRDARDDLRAQLHRAMLEARRAREELARPRETSSTPPDPTTPSGSSSMMVSAIGVFFVVAAGLAAAWLIEKKTSSSASTMRPTAGVLELATLPVDAPSRIPVRVTGTVSGDAFGSNCRGHFERAPTVVLHVREASFVTLEAHGSSADPTLALRAPGRAAFCDDDSGEGNDARLTLLLGPGSYPVWVGTFSTGATSSVSVTLEQTRAPGAAASGVVVALGEDDAPDIAILSRIPPTGGIKEVTATPGPLVSEGISGGTVQASRIDRACRGTIPFAPHVSFRLTEATNLSITTNSQADLTLLVRGSDGRIRCDDDSGEGNNARIEDRFPPGSVDVWVGALHDPLREPFTVIAEHDPAPTGAFEYGFAIESTPTFGVVDTSTLHGVWSHQGTATGGVKARNLGSSCRGELPVVAMVALNVPTATELTVGARSRTDLVMAIRHPDGTWTCDDDSDGSDTSIRAPFAPGEHRVWIGPFHMHRPEPFELYVSASRAAPRTAARARSGKSAKGDR